MKKILTLALALIFTTAFAAKKKAPTSAPACGGCCAPVVLQSRSDTASYALGISVGQSFNQQFRQMPGHLSRRVFFQAFKEVFMRGDSARLLFKADSAQLILPAYFQEQEQLQQEEAKKQGAEFLATNAKRPEVKTTPSGLQYEVIKEGNGAKPTADNTVRVHYEGKLLDGTVFDSSYQHGQPIEFPLAGVIKGWTEGLQLMPVGSKYILYVPYELGYGEQGTPGGPIPPYSTLIFTVELLDIVK